LSLPEERIQLLLGWIEHFGFPRLPLSLQRAFSGGASVFRSQHLVRS
jgi:hypothetical protein